MALVQNSLSNRHSNPRRKITEETLRQSSLPLNVRCRPEIDVKLAVETKIKQADVVEYGATVCLSHNTLFSYTSENTTKSHVVDRKIRGHETRLAKLSEEPQPSRLC